MVQVLKIANIYIYICCHDNYEDFALKTNSNSSSGGKSCRICSRQNQYLKLARIQSIHEFPRLDDDKEIILASGSV